VPYVYDPNLDQQNQQNQTQGSGTSVSISGASPTVDSNASGQSQGGATNQSQGLNTGSGFTNLDNYLKTNNAQEFGNKVLGKVGDQIQNAQSSMNQASDSFKQKVNNSNTDIPNAQQIDSAISNPTGANASQFQNWERQQYQGPHSLGESQEDYNKYWSGVQNAQTNSQLLGNDAGRFTLLDQYFGKPSYNYGEKSLDNLLFQQSGLGDQTQAIQNQATQLQTQGTQNALGLNNLAATKKSAVDDSRNSVLKAIGLDAQGNVIRGSGAGALGSVQDQIQSAYEAQKASSDAARQSLMQNINSGTITPDMAEQFGIDTKNSNGHLWNLNLNDYFNAGDAINSVNQTATAEQKARLDALAGLAGINQDFLGQVAPAKQASFNAAKFKSDQDAKMNAYLQALSNMSFSSQANDQDALQALANQYGANNYLQSGGPLLNKTPSINYSK
jgi:hypothetical protein